jgi:malate synthase
VFLTAQELLDIPHGTIRATVLIETLPAAFEMDEILYVLRDHSAGLNCGRWDYIFSAIKTRRADPGAVFPDRDQVGMGAPFMEAYTRRVVQLCHKRGVHAMGGMAAQIPIKNDPEANEKALAKVRADKEREASQGHDGTWVAHPGLVKIAKDVFDAAMPQANQIHRVPNPGVVTEAMLLAVPEGTRTEGGLRKNLRVGVQYLASWLNGQGCVPIANLMEDAATAEISRSQIWQWVKHGAKLDDGRVITLALVETWMAEELVKLRTELGREAFEATPYALAGRLFLEWTSADPLPDFLTLPATAHLRDIQE